MIWLLFASMAWANPAPPAALDNNCAKLSLAAVYSAEKAYYLKRANYHASQAEIGFTPADTPCEHWDLSIQVPREKAFVARAVNKISGEIWQIDEKKALIQVRK